MEKKKKHIFSIKRKIVTFILISSFITGFVGLALVYWSEYNLLRETISRDYISMAKLLGEAMNRIISKEIRNTEIFMSAPERLLEVEERNLRYKGMSKQREAAYFKDMDEKWLKASDSDPLIAGYTQSPIGNRLKEIADNDKSIAEIFMTDKYGGLVAASGRVSDFYQADEEWWQKSFDNGKGSIFVDKVGFDPSSNSVSIALAVPIKNKANEVIGVCKNILEVNRLFSPLQNFAIGKSGHVGLVDKQGYFVFHPGVRALTEKLSDEAFKIISRQNIGHLVSSGTDRLHKKEVFISYFKVDQPELLKSGIEWWICVTQDKDEVLAPLQKLIFSFILVALIMFVVILLIGFFFGAILVKPIIRLRDASEKVAQGNLDYKVEVRTNDEIGDLAGSFNSMLDNLKATFTTVDKLNHEINLRKKTEETLHKSEEQYRSLFTQSMDAVMLLLPDSGFISGNPAAIKMFGCKNEEEFKTCSPAGLSPQFQPDGLRSQDKARQMMDLALEKGSNLFEWTHKRMDGSEFIATVLLSRTRIGGEVLLQATVRDITEKKAAELALKRSEAWFSTTLSSIGDAVITIDTAGKVTFINPVARGLTGWLGSEAIGRHIDDVFVIRKEDTEDKAENPVLKVLSNGEIVKLANHTILISRDGERCPIDDSAAPIRSESSQEIMGVVLVFRDVTERNKVEKELRVLSVAVEQSPACIVITDLNGNIQYVNPKFIQITGYTLSEVLGKNPRILKSGEQPAEFYKNLWDTIIAGKEWQGEFHNRKKDGSLYWEGASISPIRNREGMITNYIGIKEDITERKRIFDELDHAAQEWQRTFDSIADLIFIQDKDFTILRANKSCLDALKLKPEEVIGKKCFEVLHHLDHPWVNCPFDQTRRDQKVHIEEVNDPGLGVVLLISTSPVFGGNGEFLGSIHVAKDISQIKQYQLELEQKNKDLEKLDQLKNDFVSIVSHELRTPLSITKEGISLVLDGVTGSINPKQSKILATSKNNIDRLARIINSLLDISKIESGRVELKKKSVNFEALIKNVVSSFENMAKEKGLELRVNLPKGRDLSLYIDEDRMIQVFTNLIGNALKFTEKGHIDISLEQRTNEMEFMVSDTGIGITAEDLPKVFTKFLQFGRTPGAGEKGTGLGLSIAKGLIKLHRGRIWVESEAGRGTKFIFTLPKYSVGENAREYIEDAIEDAIKSSTHVTLAVVTFSYSDKIKDAYDGLAEELLKIIKSQLYRGKDMALRYPDEFFIIMRDCEKSSGLIVQGRIEQALRGYLESVNLIKEIKINFGLATYPDEASNYQELVNKAQLV